MKKFLLYLGILLLLVVGLNFIFFAILKGEYLDEYEKFKPGFHSYIFADSHGLPLEDFLEEKRIYNFSAGSESYSEIFTKIKYANRMTGVDTILLSVDDHMLSPLREAMNNSDRVVYFASLPDFDNIYGFIKVKGIQYWIPLLNPKAANFLSKFFRRKTLSLFQKERKSKDWQYLSKSRRIELAESRKNYFYSYDSASNSLGLKLIEILDYCVQEGITVIGIKYPIADEFIQAVNNRSYNADSILINRNLPVYDFSKIYRSEIEKFSNQDHLTAAAGKEFSKLILKEIKR